MTAAPSNKDDAAIQPVCQAILGSDRGQLFSSQYVLAVERVCSMGECFIGAKQESSATGNRTETRHGRAVYDASHCSRLVGCQKLLIALTKVFLLLQSSGVCIMRIYNSIV